MRCRHPLYTPVRHFHPPVCCVRLRTISLTLSPALNFCLERFSADTTGMFLGATVTAVRMTVSEHNLCDKRSDYLRSAHPSVLKWCTLARAQKFFLFFLITACPIWDAAPCLANWQQPEQSCQIEWLADSVPDCISVQRCGPHAVCTYVFPSLPSHQISAGPCREETHLTNSGLCLTLTTQTALRSSPSAEDCPTASHSHVFSETLTFNGVLVILDVSSVTVHCFAVCMQNLVKASVLI